MEYFTEGVIVVVAILWLFVSGMLGYVLILWDMNWGDIPIIFRILLGAVVIHLVVAIVLAAIYSIGYLLHPVYQALLGIGG